MLSCAAWSQTGIKCRFGKKLELLKDFMKYLSVELDKNIFDYRWRGQGVSGGVDCNRKTEQDADWLALTKSWTLGYSPKNALKTRWGKSITEYTFCGSGTILLTTYNRLRF